MRLETLPRPDVSRFAPISADRMVVAYLTYQKAPVTLKQLRRGLKGWLTEGDIEGALETLAGNGRVRVNDKIEISQIGKDEGNRVIGVDVGSKWEKLLPQRFVLLALGLNPDDGQVRRKFAKWDAQQAAVIAVSFGLPRKEMTNTKAVCAELVWRILKAGLSELVGGGPFPPIDKLGAVERVLLAGLAEGRPVRTIPQAISALAAAAVDIKECNADSLRRRLIAIAVQRAADPTAPSRPIEKGQPASDDGFAKLVKQVAERLTTPPFEGRVAIAQVYDAYGRVNSDAGSLASFKERLIEAARKHEILLGRLDLPERMDKDLRIRSETAWDTEHMHFVLTAPSR
jgi:hypothetical protein